MKIIAIWLCATAVVIGVGAFLFAASGLYNVAASRGHFAVTRWLLEFGMQRSVSTYSLSVDAPPLHDAEMVRLGAGHFEGGCSPCHGAPGKRRNPIVRHMLPPPPDLAIHVNQWLPEQLFWIVKHGLKYTGMPGWASLQRDDEVWAVVAFLRRLPGMSETTYRELANGNLDRRERGAEDIARTGADSAALTSCIRCHGDATSPPAGRLTPKLTGQSAAYLEAALTDYAHALRPSGIMQPVAGALEPDDIRKLVDYYAGLPHGEPAPAQAADPAQVARGEAIATRGMRESGVPACVTCHVRGSPAVFPRLAGQYAPYVAGQLRLWQRGGRDQTGRGAIMAAIAKRLSGRQIDDVAAYFEQLVPPPPSGAAVGQR